MRIDHVLYATADLDAAAARLEAEHGLKAVGGGRHEGMGTHNRIVPLGDGYLEIIAVADRAEAEASDLGRVLAARIDAVGEGLLGWAVEVDDVEPVAARLGCSLASISRDGLAAGLAGAAESLAEPPLPFFISRDHGIADPGAGGEGGIEWIEVAGDAARLAEWLGRDHGLPVRVVDGGGPPGVRSVGVGGRVIT